MHETYHVQAPNDGGTGGGVTFLLSFSFSLVLLKCKGSKVILFFLKSLYGDKPYLSTPNAVPAADFTDSSRSTPSLALEN